MEPQLHKNQQNCLFTVLPLVSAPEALVSSTKKFYILFGAVIASVMLDSSACQNLKAAPQVITKFSNSVKNSLFCSDKPMEVHFSDKYLVIQHQIVHLPLKFTNNAVNTAEFWVIPILKYAIILRIPFIYKFNRRIDW